MEMRRFIAICWRTSHARKKWVRPASHPSLEGLQFETCLRIFSDGPAIVRSFVTLNIPGTELARMPATSLSV